MEAELGESSWSLAAGAVAFEFSAAVTGLAGEVFVVTDAAGTSPDTAGPVLVGGGEGAVREGGEEEAAAFGNGVAGVGLNGGPDGVRAVVDEGQDEAVARICGFGERGEGEESEKQGERGKEGRHCRGH